MYFSQVINNRVNFVSVQREFRTNEGSTDCATIPEVTLAGDFVIEFDLLIPVGVALGKVMDSGSGLNRLDVNWVSGVLDSRDYFTAYVDGVGTTNVPSDGIFHSVRLERTAINTDQTIKSVGKILAHYNGSASLAGILANLKIYDNGTLIRNYPINDGKNILANAATALGSEIDGLTYALTTAIGGVASVVLSSLSVIGKTYLVEVSYSGVVGDASVRIGGFSGPSFTGTGTIEFVATATTAVNDILGALTGVTSGSVTVSIKEAEGYGTIVNGNASDWGLFDKQANGDWLGQELVVNEVIQSVDIGGPTISTYNTGALCILGVSYKIGASVSSYSGSNTVGFNNYRGVGTSPRLSGNGIISHEFTATSTGTAAVFSRSTNQCLFRSISVKEVLKNA